MSDFLSLVRRYKKLFHRHASVSWHFKREDSLLLVVFITPFFLLLLLSILISFDKAVKNGFHTRILIPPFSSFAVASYPILASVLGQESFGKDPVTSSVAVSAQAAVVLDDASHILLSAKNPTLRFSMASTTKLMTALTAVEYYKPNDILTVFTAAVDGSKVGFHQGERVYFKDMLYGMLLPSGNDAALAIAQNYQGGETAFIARMNEKAKEYSLFNTHFSDPIGLDDDGDYTTANDLAELASIAMHNATIAQVVGTKETEITDVTGTFVYDVANLNKLLGLYGVDGVKTGYTDEAEQVLTTSAIVKGHRIITVVLKSEDRFKDTESILSFIENNVVYTTLIDSTTPL